MFKEKAPSELSQAWSHNAVSWRGFKEMSPWRRHKGSIECLVRKQIAWVQRPHAYVDTLLSKCVSTLRFVSGDASASLLPPRPFPFSEAEAGRGLDMNMIPEWLGTFHLSLNMQKLDNWSIQMHVQLCQAPSSTLEQRCSVCVCVCVFFV